MPFIACAGWGTTSQTDGSCYDPLKLYPHRDAVSPGVGTKAGWTSPQFVDIDNDGDFDLLLCGNFQYDSGAKPELCRSRELKPSC